MFVGRDNTGAARFASKRGTYDKDGISFKRDVLGSDKSIAFPIPCDPAVPWVLVFEAPIDMMSFCTLHREARSNAVALCGLYEGGLNTSTQGTAGSQGMGKAMLLSLPCTSRLKLTPSLS